MLVPNKTIPLEQSLLYKSTRILSKLTDSMSISDLYKKEKRNFENSSDFIKTLDLLFVLKKIDINSDGEVVVND